MSVKKQSKMWLMQDKMEAMNLSDIKKEEYLAETARFALLGSKSSNVASVPELSFHSMRLERRIFELEHSLSWKITSPLRGIVRKIIRVKMSITKIFTSKRNPNLLSVVVTSFNQPRHQLEKCIESILSQTFTNFRLLIWDDGSTNVETLDYLKSLTHEIDTRVDVIYEVNRGVVSARNLAARQCHSKYIAFLDPDDYLEMTFFEKVIVFAESHGVPGPAIVNPDVNVHGHQEINVWQTGELSWPETMVENNLPICSLIRLDAFIKVGGFSEDMNDGFEDWELWTRLASRGYRSKRIAEPLFHYSFQQSNGRDATAKLKSEHLKAKIKELNPKKISDKLKVGELGVTPIRLFDHTLQLPHQEKSTVFIFVPWLPKSGGAETFLKSLARGLQENGRTVCFIATKEGFASPSTSEFFDVTPYVYDLPKFLTPDSFISYVNNLLSRVPHSIVLNSGSTWLYENMSSIMSVDSGEAKCYDILYNPVGHLTNFLRHQHNFTGVVAVYENLGHVLNEYLQVSPIVSTIPVGIDEIPPLENVGIGSAPNVGWLGRLSPEKRPDWFIRAAMSTSCNSVFSLAGDGELHGELMEMLNRNSQADIQLIGHVERGTEYIASLDLLVNTSMIEGIAVTAMEAISQGIPVLAPRVGGMSELIIDGVNGYLFDPDDFKDLLGKLTKILSEPNELAKLKESTRNTRLPSRFSSVEMIAAFEDLFSNRT